MHVLDTLMLKAQNFLMWLEQWLLSPETLMQLAAVGMALAAAVILGRLMRPLNRRAAHHIPYFNRLAPYLIPLRLPVLWLIVIGLMLAAFDRIDHPVDILHPAASLITAWLIIRFAALFIKNTELGRLFVIVAWSIAALKISGLLTPAGAFLDSLAIELGRTRISVLAIISGIFIFVIMVWAALFAARLLEQGLQRMPTLTPSAQVLLSKLAKILFVAFAVLAAFTAMGVDLTALAVIGGAVGLGLGFGLQKVVSNLISGVILLLDRSIKPGDVIEVGGTYGWINKLAARYTSVITRDGREHLVPNEDMITQPVINWTYSSTKVRQRIPVGVSYKSDLRKAMDLTVEAALETPRVLKDPEPRCLVRGFGDSAVNLELRLWIADPHNGVANVASDVLLKIWDKFHEHGIEIPYPQHDLHLISAPAIDGPEVRSLLEKIRGITES